MPSELQKQSAQIDEQVNPLLDIERVYANLGAADNNHNGYMSRKDLDRGIATPSFTGDEAAALATLQKHRNPIKGLHQDGADNIKGISAADVRELGKIGRLSAMSMIADGRPIYRLMDGNKDGRLSAAELRDAAAGLQSGATKDAVEQMLKDFAVISGGAESISPEQIKTYIAKRSTREQLDVGTAVAGSMREAQTVLQGAEPELYRRPRPDERVITGDQVHQGQTGDCWLLAAVSSYAQRNPDAIPSLIKKNPDGTLTVTFPFKTPTGEQISTTIKPPTQAEIARFASNGRSGSWFAAIEKAAGQYFKEHPDQRQPLTGVAAPRRNHLLPQDHLNGARNNFALSLITGKKAETIDLSTRSTEQLHELLKGVSPSSPMTATTDVHWPKRVGTPLQMGPTIRGGDVSVPIRRPRGEEEPREPDKKPTESDDNHALRGLTDAPPREDDRPPREPEPLPIFPDDPRPEDSEDDGEGDDDDEPQPSAHDFAVLAYDEKNRTVTVRNPWGKGELTDGFGKPIDGNDDGVMVLSLAEFKQYFKHVGIVSSR